MPVALMPYAIFAMPVCETAVKRRLWQDGDTDAENSSIGRRTTKGVLMHEGAPAPSTHFLTLRLWAEQTEDDEPVWRGRVQHAATGEVCYFQGWQALQEVLLLLLEAGADEMPDWEIERVRD